MEKELQEILDRVAAKVDEKSPTEPPAPNTLSISEVMWRQGVCRNASMANCSLKNFEVNSQAQKDRMKLACWFLSPDNKGKVTQMFFYGPPGRGKTHLALGIMQGWIEAGGHATYWPLMQLVGKLKKLMTDKGGLHSTPDDFIDYLANYKGLLVIDELGRTRGESWDRDTVVYQLLDRRQGLPTIWISNYDLEQLSEIYDAAIASRLQSGKVITWPGQTIPDYRARR